ncbi:hypothetical protein ABD76_02255 [Paenibacillus dendritiformis]|uniref:DUF7660 family protein n=1 Tax=Paenibacillus dendritiformis TaxID=130049 RepID=UPI0018CE15F2|nr:hypothetical protein [Paenibacillus dendritiformis]MBG9791415.1 hypothetical protein [Paenibacillus dendritiformis]
MNKILFELIDEVTDEKSFLHFMNELRKDRANHTEEWENDSIEAFLEGASEWGLASIDGLSYYNKPDNPWKRCAQILYMGKSYE